MEYPFVDGEIALEPLFNKHISVIAGYAPAHQDDQSTTMYNGYLNRLGNWYILRSVVSGSVTTYTYIKGDSGYSTAWNNRASLDYEAFSEIF